MAREPLIIKQGDTWTLQVGWYNPIPGTKPPRPDLNSPVDITGYTASLVVVPAADHSATPGLTLTSPSGGLTVTGPAGTVGVRATPAQTALLAEGFWWWEVEIENGTDTYTLADGPLSVVAEVA